MQLPPKPQTIAHITPTACYMPWWSLNHKADSVITAIDQATHPFYTAITAGNLAREVEKRLLETESLSKFIPLVGKPLEGWTGEQVIIPEKRILRPYERARFVAEKLTTLGNFGTVNESDVLDLTEHKPVHLGELLVNKIESTRADHILVPVGSGGLYLSAVQAAEKASIGTTVWGYLPRKQNGVFVDNTSYTYENGAMYYTDYTGDTLAQKLTCPYTDKRANILAATRRGHKLFAFSDEELKEAYALGSCLLSGHDIDAYAGVIGLLPKRKWMLRKKTVLVLLTGTTNDSEQVGNQIEAYIHLLKHKLHGTVQDHYRGLQLVGAEWKENELLYETVFRDFNQHRTVTIDTQTLDAQIETDQQFNLLEETIWDFPTDDGKYWNLSPYQRAQKRFSDPSLI